MYQYRGGSSRFKLLKCHILSLYSRHIEEAKCKREDEPLGDDIVDFSSTFEQDESPESVKLDESTTFVGEFDDLEDLLSDRLLRALKSAGFTQTTYIQNASIPKILGGSPTLIRSATGSGKTLAFLIPAIQRLVAPTNSEKITRKDGTKVLIIVPTRELSLQTATVAENVSKPFPWIVVSSIIGGDSRKSEKARIRKGITLLVGTPGRILDHCEHTAAFNVSSLELFVLDEADRLLDMGFESKIKNIFGFLRESRSQTSKPVQTVLTSATLTDGVMKLANFCFIGKPVMIGMQDEIMKLPPNLVHEYVLTDCKNKFICLVALLLKYIANQEKVIIFVSNCPSVIYMSQLLKQISWPTRKAQVKQQLPKGVREHEDEIYEFDEANVQKAPTHSIFNIPIYSLHGNMDPNDRYIFYALLRSFRNGYTRDFIKSKCAILISTDVASRGLNLSEVDRVIQYDPPQQLEEYVHRSGRTARIGGNGSALLILMYHEAHFVDSLRKLGVSVKQIMEGSVWSYIEQTYCPKSLRNFKGDFIGFMRNKFEEMVQSDSDLKPCAERAFRASVQSYKTYSRDLRRIFDFKKLHLGHYATSFCISSKPSEIIKPKPRSSVKRPAKDKQNIANKSARISLTFESNAAALQAVEFLKKRDVVM
ncbi:DEAD box ATP-dependent RNA helicase family member protein [Theileria equi strain WA]|uniref:ATP-dependent RNA helicase n=1 Tax=Theileria equi strain WA TaxID=1537102 RepID=L1LF46_THEEQ|nr:DEAD box ATP-dependent RNA helicase family member protein [Theileria equi strain WA]EKX73909.1 DEAD box ATP-dependent RNA helicase family member protein [Theileria equi strain WA]|eukprot:XP_004833361.1 DEAD box ATP-dependent RNA helicase family member protein [Theileria equi strain WA]